MSDEQNARSGSRWEPGPADETVAQPTTPPEPPASGDTGSPAPAPVTTPVARPSWTQRARGNGGLVGAALALVLVSGVGGFAIGHATAGPDRFGLVGERYPGGPGGFPGADRQLPPPRHDDGPGFGTPPGSDDDGGGAGDESGSTL